MIKIMFLSNVDGRIIPSGFTEDTIPEDDYFETGPIIYFFDMSDEDYTIKD